MNVPEAISVRVSRARDSLEHDRRRLNQIVAHRGLDDREQLINSFRGPYGELDESESFHEAVWLLASVEHLEQLLEGRD